MATPVRSTGSTENSTALINETTTTASGTQPTLMQWNGLALQIRKAQLEAALTRAALAKLQLKRPAAQRGSLVRVT